MKIQTGKQTLPQSARYWQAHIKALSESGLSRAEYCRRQELSYHALVYWQRKFAKKAPQAIKLVPVTVPQVSAVGAGNRTGDAGLKILLPGKLTISVGDNFSPATLVRLLNILETR